MRCPRLFHPAPADDTAALPHLDKFVQRRCGIRVVLRRGHDDPAVAGADTEYPALAQGREKPAHNGARGAGVGKAELEGLAEILGLRHAVWVPLLSRCLFAPGASHRAVAVLATGRVTLTDLPQYRPAAGIPQ